MAGEIGGIVSLGSTLAVIAVFINMAFQYRFMDGRTAFWFAFKLMLISMFSLNWVQFNSVANAIIDGLDHLAGGMIMATPLILHTISGDFLMAGPPCMTGPMGFAKGVVGAKGSKARVRFGTRSNAELAGAGRKWGGDPCTKDGGTDEEFAVRFGDALI